MKRLLPMSDARFAAVSVADGETLNRLVAALAYANQCNAETISVPREDLRCVLEILHDVKLTAVGAGGAAANNAIPTSYGAGAGGAQLP